MGAYFKNIPLVVYGNLEDSNNNTNILLTNLLTRSAFIKEVMENSAVFYEYEVKENETPEMIADKLYGDVERFWIILLFNNIMNPLYDFPLNQEQLNDLIVSKYGYSVEDSQTIVHHYERRVTRTILLNGIEQSSNTETVTISAYEQDPNTGLAVLNPLLDALSPDTGSVYDTTTDTFSNGISVVTTYEYWLISVYGYEHDLNEQKRRIRLLDAAYVNVVEAELKRLMTNG